MLVASGIGLDRVREALPGVEPYAVDVRLAPAWFRRLWAKGISAVTMPWAVYATPEAFAAVGGAKVELRFGELIVHELAHIEQFRHLGAIRHIAGYAADYLRGRLRRQTHWEAYRNVRLEVEARQIAGAVCAPLRPGGGDAAGGGSGGAW